MKPGQLTLERWVRFWNSADLVKLVQQFHLSWNLVGEFNDWKISSSISAIRPTLRSHSKMLGGEVSLQCVGMQSLAALISCKTIVFLYMWWGNEVWWSRNWAAEKSGEWEVIRGIIRWTPFQKGCIAGQSHQICKRVPKEDLQRQHVGGVAGLNLWMT